MRILCPVVQSFMLSMLDTRHDLLLCRTVAGQLISDYSAWRPALSLQQLAQEPFGGPFVSPALHQDIEHDAVLVHRAPHPVLLTGNLDRDLIETPFISGTGQTSPDPVGEVLAELPRPLTHALVAD